MPKNYQVIEKKNTADLLCELSDGLSECVMNALDPMEAGRCDLEEVTCHQCICEWLNREARTRK